MAHSVLSASGAELGAARGRDPRVSCRDPCCNSYMAPVRMTHKPSLSQSVFSMALPLFSARICAVLARVTPMAKACSLPAWEPRWLSRRPAGSPPAALSARSCLRLPQALASLGHSAG